ncbi:MAG: SRPBCC family protein [Chloroflexi bacterium]|nr:SRPBCC family protein [Chloroflexota bacterium]
MRVRSFEMTSTVTVNAPFESVWMALTDANRWPEWCRVCPSVSAAPQVWSPGETLSFKLRMAGIAVPFNVRLTDVESGRRVSWVSTKFTIKAGRTISLEPRDAGVTVTDHKRFSSPVVPVGVYYPQFLIRRMTESWLEDLKAEAERLAGRRWPASSRGMDR